MAGNAAVCRNCGNTGIDMLGDLCPCEHGKRVGNVPVNVVIVHLEGSPGQVFDSLEAATEEICELVRAQWADETRPTSIHVRTGTMGRKFFNSAKEHMGY